jgi:hypothetical protein
VTSPRPADDNVAAIATAGESTDDLEPAVTFGALEYLFGAAPISM